MIRTFVDSGVYLAAWKLTDTVATQRAIDVLVDPARARVYTPFVALEVLPLAVHHARHDEVAFYTDQFSRCVRASVEHGRLIAHAEAVAGRDGLSAMDALHIAAAELSHCTEFVTMEKPTGPFARVRMVKVVSLYEPSRK